MYAMLQYKGTGNGAKRTQMVNEVWSPIIKELRKRPITSSTIRQEALVQAQVQMICSKNTKKLVQTRKTQERFHVI